ncbi:DedA family protein [Arthrobacter sp. HY1533]|uniref:DedA family protein n=1 Tax=Arthrobacter sp. HY1533 TaxID=2970919 RepID=UPI0022BA0BD9|nr:DedA family protein [Arthrobacter sp. HY1533]
MTEMLLAAAEQPWIYAAVALACLIDGFFPPIPSEAIVVGLASLGASQGGHGLWLLLLTAVLGAFAGDNLAYLLGRGMGTARFKWMRRPLMQRAFSQAGRELKLRPVSMLLVARFVPVARVAVNLTAGATGYRYRRFAAVSALSATLWGAYSVGIGALAGAWLQEYPVWGLVIAIVVAGALGLFIDKVAAALRGRRGRRQVAPSRQLQDARN